MKRALFFVSIVSGWSWGQSCQITSPLPVPISIAGCTFTGPLPAGSTTYIQNTLSPTTTTQVASLQQVSVSTLTVSSQTVTSLFSSNFSTGQVVFADPTTGAAVTSPSLTYSPLTLKMGLGSSIGGFVLNPAYFLDISSDGSTNTLLALRNLGLSSTSTSLLFQHKRLGSIKSWTMGPGIGSTSTGFTLRDTLNNSIWNVFSPGYMGLNDANEAATFTVQSIDNTLPAMIVKSSTTQTADIQDWTDPSGNVLAGVTIGGGVTLSSAATFNGNVIVSSAVTLGNGSGTNGQVFTSGGLGTVPTWTTIAGGGGGGASGTINAANQFSVPYYSLGGSSTSLSAYAPVTFSTASIGVTIATTTNLGGNAYAVSITSNAIMPQTTVYQNGELLIGSSTVHNGALYISSTVILSNGAGTNGQALTSGGLGTAPTWTTISGSGGSFGQLIYPSTGTPNFPFAMTASSISVSSNSFLGGSTFYQDGTARIGGVVTASNLSGTNTGDQTITLTGDVTGSGTGSFATTAAATQPNIKILSAAVTHTSSVTFTSPVLFNGTIISTAPVLLTTNTVIGAGTTFYQDGTAIIGGNVKAANLSGSNTGDQTITLTGDVTGSGTGSFAATAAAQQGNIKTFTSSITITGSGGLTMTYGVSAGTLTLTNSTSPTTLLVDTAATGISQLAVSSAVAIAGTDPIVSISSASGTTVLWVSNAGNLISSGTTTTVTSCGTSPSVAGNNIAGQITVGGGVVTACTLNFANGGFGNPPICTFSDNSTTVNPSLGATSGTSVVINLSATLGGGLIDYVCLGYQR